MVVNQTEVWLIRHGESQQNAGFATLDPASTQLTDKGNVQGRKLSAAFPRSPSLIVTSSYVRALETAKYTAQKFPLVPIQEWPVQEFTYLCPDFHRNTTATMRVPFVETYWRRADPLFVDGQGAESFAEFVQRVQDCDTRCRKHEGLVAVFTHSQFIHGVMMLLLPNGLDCKPESMRRFRGFCKELEIPNAAIVKVQYRDASVSVSEVVLDHL